MKIVEILAKSAILLGLNEEHALLLETQTHLDENLLTTQAVENSQDTENSTENTSQINTIKADFEQELLTNKNIKSLYHLIGYSLQELCTNYIPVVSRVCKQTSEKAIKLSEFENFIRVQNIVKNGESVKAKIVNRAIIFDEDGCYNIEYLTYPSVTSIFDEIDFLSSFSVDVLVCSVCAYFSLANGLFEEFKDFHEMYIEKAENIKELKSFNLPQRRWE